MSIEKAELKMAVANEVGARIEDQLEYAQRETYKSEGAVSALKQAASMIEAINLRINKDLDAGKLKFETELEVAQAIKTYITQAVQLTNTMADTAGKSIERAKGAVAAIQNTVKIVKAFHTEENAKLLALRRAEEENSGEEKRQKGHPGSAIGKRRAAEKKLSIVEDAPVSNQAELEEQLGLKHEN